MRLNHDLAASLAEPALEGGFVPSDLDALPEPVRRYFSTAIAPGTPLAVAARIRMRGSIRLGRWLPFRARQVLAPHRGTVWSARVGGLIVGSDHYADGRGALNWRLLGVLPVMRADGADVSRSSAERAAGEAFWIPTALLPRLHVEWTALDDSHIQAGFDVDGHPVQVRSHVGGDGRVRSLVFDRWGDPDGTGSWSVHPCGCEVTGHGTFDGVTIPTAGRVGWFFGTDRWDDGVFFRYEITALELVTRSTGRAR